MFVENNLFSRLVEFVLNVCYSTDKRAASFQTSAGMSAPFDQRDMFFLDKLVLSV